MTIHTPLANFSHKNINLCSIVFILSYFLKYVWVGNVARAICRSRAKLPATTIQAVNKVCMCNFALDWNIIVEFSFEF